ncbi:MAG: TRM11 family SAM-dependent methyltransferase [Egibacteraceae bacterium]
MTDAFAVSPEDRTKRPRLDGRPATASFFATTLPGLGTLLRAEIAAHPDLEPDCEMGYDGRADIVVFRARRGARWQFDDLRLAEDVFAKIADASSGPPGRVANALITRTGLERALSTWARFVRPLSSAMTFRAITRVVDERRFKRTELRGAVTKAIAANRPRWRTADPADLEIWVLEHRRAWFVAGIRLSDKRMRQHGEGRTTERHGALRPVVAAAMMHLAGDPPARVLDPCCGTGTIVREALRMGWEAYGSDIDEQAVSIARTNVPEAVIEREDVLNLSHPDGSFDAVVANLPFGKQFHVDRDPKRWVIQALREAARVTRPGGRVIVLLPPPAPRHPAGLALTDSYPLRLLGVSTRIWGYDRDEAGGRDSGAAPTQATGR